MLPRRGPALSHGRMAAETNDQVTTGRRHIIKRPRLTRILDESNAQVLMLIAPAGYGKTTLAREWLHTQRFTWYQGGPASADVAALAVGVADACSSIVPNAGERMRARLRATSSPEQDVDLLAELLGEDLEAWPSGAWLTVDDYHFLSESAASERFIDLLLSRPVRLTLTSRRRPRWASARRLIYGELCEVGRNVLAMTQDEAAAVLANRRIAEASGIFALAEGWPAVIGLAALTGSSAIPDHALPASLHEFFAEELYQMARPRTRRALQQMAVAPSITHDLVVNLFGSAGRSLVDEGIAIGVLTQNRNDVELHPLIRSFLLSRTQMDSRIMLDALSQIANYYVASEAWDELFSLIESVGGPQMMPQLLRPALLPTLKSGRFPTLSRWVSHARQHKVHDPVVDLAEAELAFRRGENRQAEVMALHASAAMPASDALASRAFFIAGDAAHLDHRDEQALTHFARARARAAHPEDAWRALYGQVLSAASLHDPEATKLVLQLQAFECNEPDFLLCRATASGVLGVRMGTLEGLASALMATLPLAAKARDPLVRLAYLLTLAQVFSLEAKYAESIEVIERIVSEAESIRLAFVLPHVYTSRAYSELGIRRFREALALLDKALITASVTDNPHALSNTRPIRARVLLAQGFSDRALEVLEADWDSASEPAMLGEFEATRALVFACRGLHDEARASATRATRITTGVEALVLARCAEAISASLLNEPGAQQVAKAALQTACQSRNFDGLVCSYRAYPPLLRTLSPFAANQPEVLRVLASARDHALAKRSGLSIEVQPDTLSELTKREREVLGLVAQGLTNKEIASRLYVSASTIKVHVLHILDKLGARSRTEAAKLAIENGLA